MTIRSQFRVKPWRPVFDWYLSIPDTAHAINRSHEDYPRRVAATADEITRLGRGHVPAAITGELLRQVHGAVFADTKFAGRWKIRDIFFDAKGRPKVSAVADLMARLDDEYQLKKLTVDILGDWYVDFETIHPFPDGNGRTGGIIVAVYSHRLHPNRGWLAPQRSGRE